MTILIMCENCNGEGKVDSGITDFELTPIFVECSFCFGTGCTEDEVSLEGEIDTHINE